MLFGSAAQLLQAATPNHAQKRSTHARGCENSNGSSRRHYDSNTMVENLGAVLRNFMAEPGLPDDSRRAKVEPVMIMQGAASTFYGTLSRDEWPGYQRLGIRSSILATVLAHGRAVVQMAGMDDLSLG
ncbi:hypothetical protein DFH29DRAFT_878486 [Suillus ampliporus]|nr:hypothetical protein DFH29DRAFT_878486 [Suillus ampliporus]